MIKKTVITNVAFEADTSSPGNPEARWCLAHPESLPEDGLLPAHDLPLSTFSQNINDLIPIQRRYKITLIGWSLGVFIGLVWSHISLITLRLLANTAVCVAHLVQRGFH